MKNNLQNLLRRIQVVVFLVIVTGMTCCTVQEYTDKADKGAEAYELIDSLNHQMKVMDARLDSIEQGLDTLSPSDIERLSKLTRLHKATTLSLHAR